MSGNGQRFLEETADTIMRETRRQRRSRILLVIGLVLIAGLLTGLAVVSYVNARADQGRQRDLDQMKTDLREFCEQGVIDCRGHAGLPGAKGEVGTGISDVDCVNGRFRVSFTNGRTDSVGSCVAQRGPRGPRGYRGPRGHTGHTGKHGAPGKPGKTIIVHGHSHGHRH